MLHPIARKPPPKIDIPVAAIVAVVVLTIVAAAYRVSTAPERIRTRLNAARDACLSAGGDWVRVGREEWCRPAAQRGKV